MSNYATLKAAISTAIKQNGNEEITGQVLQTTLLSMVDSLVSGYLFKGIATPSTVVGTPDENVFWIAPAGSYSNFGATPIDVPTGCIGIFQYNGSFTNTVVYVGGTVDISALSHTAYASLSQALGDLPSALHIGGIEVRYQDSTTSKFVKYRLMATSWSTTEANWQGVDDEPTAGSDNLVKSGGVYEDVSQLGQRVDGVDIKTLPTFRTFNGPFSTYSPIYVGVIPKGCIIVNNSSKNIAVYLEGESSYVLVSRYSELLVNDKNAVLVQTLGAAFTETESVIVMTPISMAINGIEPVGSILNKSKNLFNPYADDITPNAYMDYAGVTYPSNSYSTSGYIRVLPNTNYVFSVNGVSKYVHYVLCFSAEKVPILSVGEASSFTTPAGCYFIRFDASNTDFNTIQLEQGNSPTAYVGFFEKVKNELLPEMPDNAKMNALPISGTLNNGQSLSIPINVFRNLLLSCKITGNLSNVKLGVGLNGYYTRYLEITPTQLSLYWRSGVLKGPVSHGLTLGNFTTIELLQSGSNLVARLMNNDGEIYEWEMTSVGLGGGNPFIKNDGSESIVIDLKAFPKDLSAKIWGFGDSYFSYQDPARWTYYALQCGFDKWLINQLGGENSLSGLADFNKLISSGAIPQYILWCYGMNDGSDTNDTTPNADWLSCIQSVISTCEQLGITPILATIPSVPSISHIGKNAWVRNSGYRYIDFATYVESPNDNYWRNWGEENALLSSDEVHPTEAGAKVLWQAVLNGFPEIATNY